MKRAVVLLLLAAPAFAYLLPAGSLLRRSAQRREDSKAWALLVHGTVALFGESARAASVAEGQPVPATLRFQGPQNARVELALPQGPSGHARKPGSKGEEFGVALPALAPLAGDAIELLAARRTGEGLISFVHGRGVDLSVVSLSRLAGRVAYVIGAAPHDKAERAQVWIDKDSFQPVRLYLPAEQSEVVFATYGKPPLYDQWPRTIELRRAGALEARFTAESAEVPSSNPG